MSPGEYQAHHMWTKLTETKVSRQNAVLPVIQPIDSVTVRVSAVFSPYTQV